MRLTVIDNNISIYTKCSQSTVVVDRNDQSKLTVSYNDNIRDSSWCFDSSVAHRSCVFNYMTVLLFMNAQYTLISL